MAASDVELMLAAMQKECHEFRHRLNDEVAKHFRCQELLLLDFLQNVESARGCASTGSNGYAKASHEASLSDSPISGSKLPLPSDALLQAGDSSEPPRAAPSAAAEASTGAEQMLSTALSPLEKSVHRVEAMLLRQQRTGSSTMLASTGSSEAPTMSSKPEALRRSPMLHFERVLPEGGYGSSVSGTFGQDTYNDMFDTFHHWTRQQNLWHQALYNRCGRSLDWFLELQEPERTGWLASLVNSKPFETLCACVILTNAAVSSFAINHEVSEIYDGDVYFQPSDFVANTEIFFVSFYTLELFLKAYVHRLYLFVNNEWRWNIFDGLLVVLALVDQIIMRVIHEGGNTNVTFMRTLRILKIARVLRGLRVMRFFYELRLMLNSIVGSIASLFWSIVMLLLIYYIFALVFVQGVSNYLLDIMKDAEGTETVDSRLMHNFGQVEKAILALYQSSTGGMDWYEPYGWIRETGDLYAFIYLLFIAFSQIALLNILTAIFVQRAMRLVQPDRETMALEQRSTEMAEFEDLRKIMRSMDVDGKGTVNIKDLRKQINKDPRLAATLAMLGIYTHNLQLFFGLAAPGSESEDVPIDRFVEGCMRMRGSAQAIDMLYLNQQMTEIQASQMQFEQALVDRLDLLAARRESPGRAHKESFV